MSYISKVKLGSTIYDIRDSAAFKYAALGRMTDSQVANGQFPFSKISFYDKSGNGATELCNIPLSELIVNELGFNSAVGTGLYASTVETDKLYLSDDVYLEYVTNNNQQYIVIHAKDSSDNAIQINLPVGQNGTISLSSDLSTIQSDLNTIKTLLNVEGTDVQGVIDKYDEIVDFLTGLSESPTLVTQLAEKVYSILYDETNTKPKLIYKKTSSGAETTIVELDTTPTSGSKKPITSGGVYTALQNLGPYVSDVSYDNSTRVLSKTKNGSTSGLVALPTAVYSSQTETLELILPAVPS